MKQKLKGLHEQLQRWQSHGEVHAKPSDKILYELLHGVLGVLGEITEKPEEPKQAEAPEIPVANESESFVPPAGDEDGSNPPGHGPATPP